MSMKSKLGMSGAILTLAIALLTPFLLMGTFAKGFMGLGLHVDERYSGGRVVRQTTVNGHTLSIHEVVRTRMMQRGRSFVQVDWENAPALPGHVEDVIDLDGDGRLDVRVRFDVPANPKAPLFVDAEPLSGQTLPLNHAGKRYLDGMIARVDQKIVVRLPLAER
jgi:hypothetical protein